MQIDNSISMLPLESPAKSYQITRIAHWDEVASQVKKWKGWGGLYHRRLTEVYRSLIPPGQRVIELGCGDGDLLAAMQPSYGVGVDFSGSMIQSAKNRYPQLHFIQEDIHELQLDKKFDFIILSDLVNDLWDVQAVLERIKQLTTPETRLVINAYSRLWEFPLNIAGRLRLSKPNLYQNWLTVEDITNLLRLAGFDAIRHWEEILLPLPLPLLHFLANRYLVKLWPFRLFALTNFIISRPSPQPCPQPDLAPIVSVIIPTRNEAGNIEQIFKRVPTMGGGTELIFVEGHSKDDTYLRIEQACIAYPEKRAKLFRQTGVGKGDAVRLGFSQAEGDILMILDGDLTVPPEDLPRFYDVLLSGKSEFVNGVRLVYPMEDQSMRFANLVGNKFFSLVFSWLLGQPIKDTLCGTKVLRKVDYERIAANRSYFGDFDPFGDFDLLFGAAKLNLKIAEIPIRYGARTYGTTNIQRWKHGWLLLRMVFLAAGRIKFI
jgi:SAM-dependent methyltransferase